MLPPGADSVFYDHPPIGRAMTPLAAAVEGASMYVLTGMAAVAGWHRCRRIPLFHRRFVTCVAICFCMGAVQHKTGLVVIIVPALPGARVVTCRAIDAKPAFVHIIFFVAGVAIRGSVLERERGFVTLFAFNGRMAASQRES